MKQKKVHNEQKIWFIFIPIFISYQERLQFIWKEITRCEQDVVGDGFELLDDIWILEIPNLLLNEPKLEVILFNDDDI